MLESVFAVFEEKIPLTPRDLGREITSFDTVLLDKLKLQIEGKCSKHGYLVPGSLELLSRSIGYSEKGRFTGDFLYYIKAQGRVYNPPDGTVVEGEVIRKNKMGLYVIVQEAIKVMIPRDLHIGNEEFDTVEIGEKIRIEIKKSRFQMNESHILSVGEYLGRAGGIGEVEAEAEEAEAEEAEAEEAEAEEAEAEEAEAEEAEAEEADAEESVASEGEGETE